MDPRHWMIELIAYWEGRVTTRHLCDQFGISRQQASKDIKSYNGQAITPLHYSTVLKGHLPDADFQPSLITQQVDEYLRWLASSAEHHTDLLARTLTFQLATPQRHVSPAVMRGLVAAMRQQQRLEVDYVSLSQPDREGRIIVPHAFINTGARWHLRAWCEKRGEYRDFVLSRFRGKPELSGHSEHGAASDTAWNTEVELIVQPDVRLSAAQQAVIADDYQMKDGLLRLSTRAALVSYLLQQMQINTKVIDANPQAQQLMLVNLDDIKPWLMA